MNVHGVQTTGLTVIPTLKVIFQGGYRKWAASLIAFNCAWYLHLKLCFLLKERNSLWRPLKMLVNLTPQRRRSNFLHRILKRTGSIGINRLLLVNGEHFFAVV